MEKIVEYLKEKYDPVSIILYGSYADGSNNAGSDFDALVISKSHEKYHDMTFIGQIPLDVFVYPASFFEDGFEPSDFPQLFDGNIVLDTAGIGESAKNRVLEYINNIHVKTEEEICSEIEWCKKMLIRARRGDEEGMFRWHWLLTESLEIFCDAAGIRYFGPKKSLKQMKREYPKAYEAYSKALLEFTYENTEEWICFLEKFYKQ